MKHAQKSGSMIVAGVMSGTSADGVDVALCRIGPGTADASPRVRLLGMESFPYPKAVRAEVLAVAAGAPRSAAELGRLNLRLGQIYAECVAVAAKRLDLRPALVGCHGQTIHHEAMPTAFLGRKVRSTWQIGESSAIAEQMQCPVVSDFRPADLAAGGQGAPLVPMLDWSLFRSAKRNRVLLNLGGIANMTVIPAGARQDEVIAFDSGPANMAMDALMQRLFQKPFDRDGKVAARGLSCNDVVGRVLRDRYYKRQPPKSCGREQFGSDFSNRLLDACRRAGASDPDCIATATALTSESVVDAYRRFAVPRFRAEAPVEVCVAGGGARNNVLMEMLRQGLGPTAKLLTMDELGIPSQAKEAVAFALLAWLTWHGLPGNVPSATGASRSVVLGKVTRP